MTAAAHVVWSRNSSRLLTIQTNDCHVEELPVIQFALLAGVSPSVITKRVALPGDANIPTFAMLVFEVASSKKTGLRYPEVPAVRMLDTPISGNRAWWAADSRTVYFVDVARGEHCARLVAADAVTMSADAPSEVEYVHGQILNEPIRLRACGFPTEATGLKTNVGQTAFRA